jgi:predicted outer membrane protein
MKTTVKSILVGMLISAGIVATTIQASAQAQQRQQRTQKSSSQQKPGGEAAQESRHSDGEFVRRISEENMAEIELAKLALEKASSERVKVFAQHMIDDHTRWNEKIAGLLDRSRIMTDTDTYRDKDLAGTGKGVDTDADTSSGVALDMDEGVESGTNTGTGIDDPTGSASDSRINTTVKPGVPTGTNMKTGMGTGEIPTSSSVMKGDEDLETTLNKEDRALYNRLSKLSGAEFDRQYIQSMIKEHKKLISLLEQQAQYGRNDALRQFAIDAQPMAREHKEQVMQMEEEINKKGSQHKKDHK